MVNMYFPRWSSQRGFYPVEVLVFSHDALDVLALFITKDLLALVLTENPFLGFKLMALLSSETSPLAWPWHDEGLDAIVLFIGCSSS